MSDSILTKTIIADTFRGIMAKKSFEKITISVITDQCGLNRQSFYYHFKDKYELLNWILFHEIIMPFSDGLNSNNWNEKLLDILFLIKENSRFYSNAFNTTHGYEFRHFLLSSVTNIFNCVIDQITDGVNVTPEDKTFIAEFLSYGVSGSVSNWVRTGMKQDPKYIVLHLRDIVNGLKSYFKTNYLTKQKSEPK